MRGMNEIIIATHNAGKLIEFQKLLGPYVPKISSAADHDLPEPIETGTTFHENAALKAIAAASATGIPALADDSGLCVDALGGAPGIYSARWTYIDPSPAASQHPLPLKGRGNYQHAVDRIFRELNGRAPCAEFVCVLALAQPDGKIEYAEGHCAGTLIPHPRGEEGFGYDPYFIPDGHTKTFAELGKDVKDKISHRALAYAALRQKMRGEMGEGRS